MKLPDRKQILSLLLLTVALVFSLFSNAFAAPGLTLGTASGGAGTTVTIPVTLTNQSGTSLAALDLTIGYDASVLQNPRVAIGQAATDAGKMITKNLAVNPMIIGVLGLDNNNAIGNGVVATLTFDIKIDAAAGASVVSLTPDGSDPDGITVAITGSNGTVNVTDTTKPGLSLSTLANGAKTNLSPLNISGTATDNVAVTAVTVNGTAAIVGTGGAFSHALPLVAGANTVTVIASDVAGNTTTEIRTITYENVAPVLTITAPATDNSFTNQAALTISGTVNETATISLTFNTVPITAVMSNNSFTASVTLINGQNTIDYSAMDEFGNLSQSVKRTITYDPTSPSVAITDPFQDIKTNVSSYLLKGTVTDTLTSATVALTVDAQNYNPPVTNGIFEQLISFTSEKSYQISVVATDAAGNSSPPVLRNIIFDTTPPPLLVTTGTLITNAGSFTLTGTRENGSTLSATCTTAAVTVNQPDSINWTVDLAGLAAGDNLVAIRATDAAGNTAERNVTVIRDNILPAVDTFTLPGLSNIMILPITAFAASDANGVAAYLVTETTAPPTANDAGWTAAVATSFTFSSEGFKTLYAYAKDNAGNISTAATAATTIDTTSPVVTITGAPAALVKDSTAALTFSSVDTAATFECKLDTGAFAACTSIKNYTALADGLHTFTVRAKDPAGNISETKTATWIVDTINPTLTISALSNGAATNTTPLNISGTVADANGVASLTVNGIAVTVTSGAFSYALPLTTEGDVAVTVVATDNAGNTASDSRSIKYDTTLPTLTITAPADNSQTKEAALAVTGTVSEAGTVELKNTTGSTTQPAAMNGLGFSGTIQLVSGSNTIEVTVTDAAGNTSTAAKRTVLYDPLSPALAITDPPQDTMVHVTAVTIKGSVTDATNINLTLTFNDTTYTPTVTAGLFEQAITIPAEGSYPVVVTATDAVGNPPSTVTRNIIYTLFPGDVNGDGSTTKLGEVLKAFQYVYGQGTLAATEKVRLDCAPLDANGKPSPNGVVDTGDVILLLRRIVGLVNW